MNFTHSNVTVSVNGKPFDGITSISYEAKPSLPVVDYSASGSTTGSLTVARGAWASFTHHLEVASMGRYWWRRREKERQRDNRQGRRRSYRMSPAAIAWICGLAGIDPESVLEMRHVAPNRIATTMRGRIESIPVTMSWVTA